MPDKNSWPTENRNIEHSLMPGNESKNEAQGARLAGEAVNAQFTAERVVTLLQNKRVNLQAQPFDGSSPYLGLAAFGEGDADRFFGREAEVAELVSRLKDSRCIFVTGPSGSGKSSFVSAGLIHRLKSGALGGSERWLYAMFQPGTHVLEQLALAMADMAKSPEAGDTIRRNAMSDVDALSKLVESTLRAHNVPGATIIVDQFEEALVPTTDEAGRTAFLNLLVRAATARNGHVAVIFVLRSDFVSDCAAYPQLNALLNRQLFQLGAMQPDDLVGAIAMPALRQGVEIDPDLVARVVNDMQGDIGALPLMQFALKDLFDEQQRAGGIIALTLAGYLKRGGLQVALERHADAEIAQLSDTEQELARAILAAVTLPIPGRQDMSRTVLLSELISADVDRQAIEAVVQKLAAAQLLTVNEEPTPTAPIRSVSLAHEKLIDAWPWLRRLVDDSREVTARQSQIAADAHEWDSRGRDSRYLYSGAKLALAGELLHDTKITLSNQVESFVNASVEADEAKPQTDSARHPKQTDKAPTLVEESHGLPNATGEQDRQPVQSIARPRRRSGVMVAASLIVLVASILVAGLSVSAANNANRNAALAAAEKNTAVANANAFATAESNAKNQGKGAQQQAAFARQLAAQAVGQIHDHIDLALLLGIEAYRFQSARFADTLETRDSFLRVLQSNPRLRAILFGHTGKVLGVAFSPDGRLLASASEDHTVRLWDVTDLASAKPLGQPLAGHSDRVAALAFSPNGKILASVSYDTTILLWDVTDPASPKPLGQPLTGHTDILTSVAFSPDGKTLASGGRDRTIRLWDVTDPAAPQPLGQPLTGHTDMLTGVAFSPDGKTLVSASYDHTIRLWNITDRTAPSPLGQPITDSTDKVLSIAFSPNGNILASTGGDQTLRLWDMTDPAAPKLFSKRITGRADLSDLITAITFSPDGKTLASANVDQTVSLWDVSDPAAPRPLGLPLVGHTDWVISVAFSPDGKTLASASADQTVRLWNVADPAASGTLGQSLTGHTDKAWSLAYSPDGKILASASSDKTVRLWNVTDPTAPSSLGQPLTGHTAAVSSVVFSPDGKILASASLDKTIRLWDMTDRAAPKPLGAPLVGHTGAVLCVAFSPDGKILASGSLDKSVRLWDMTDPAAPKPLGQPITGYSGNIWSLAFSPDGKTLVSAGNDQSAPLWDVTDPAKPKPLGQLLIGHTTAMMKVAFSPNGKIIVSTFGDQTVHLWDVTNLTAPQPLGQPLSGSIDKVLSVVFSPDGKTLASASADDDVRLWDVTDPAAPKSLGAPLAGHTDWVTDVAFSPDGKTLASISTDTTIILWPIAPDQWIARACQIVGRNFRSQEWKQYFPDEPFRKTCAQWPGEVSN